jgi:hypothetical protein
MKFIRDPVKLEFNLCALFSTLFALSRYRVGTIAGAQPRGWNDLLCLGFGECFGQD